jgi:rare lipoprotein A
VIIAAALSGCGTITKRDVPKAPSAPRGGYYLDDGPGSNPPVDLDAVPDAVPRLEPLHRGAARPYTVMGRSYSPMTTLQPYRARGVASWYGRRYHGKPTASGEPYDMYAMTAAHPTLPIPSYARVTNLANGRSVVVRVNDRGPFLGDRLIDLSYTAAYKLDLIAAGSGLVEVESIIPGGTTEATQVAAAPPVPAGAGPAPAAVTASASAHEISPPSPSPIPMDGSTGRVYLQLGAFASRDNAESYLTRLKLEVEWLADRLHLFPRDGLYRVHAGPYASPLEARQIADRIGQDLGIKPVMQVR